VRVVVTGATGNVGTSVLDALGADPSVDSIVGWAPRWTAGDALLDLLGGFADSASGPTPALARRAPPVPA